ncbi:MAG: family 78 glycoside hydrolase catalytic domain [Bacteroidales bacterium]|uniref:family 78 glycoside hydrolase catalytic domain n=1 Tax=Candidatus Cryptobacteroides sp. TaxID=2952915 RepID=UPI002A756A09|nr:family 78 glycoside hydrolase catalytic domain [Candidatus Cryptobacteroides sp.]MDD7233947.1 family 78 glycoside hydrolase catalytic domain [Bacteroidales bacterium]MDY2702236.1 family 78 glycoside hydrolase catalytic domain [Candidatus Cryptobacteroides sp.]
MRFISSFATFICLTATLISCSRNADQEANLSDLRCEYLESPISIDTQTPRFTWTYSGDSGFTQDSYTVSVASAEEKLSDPDIWCSGAIVSAAPFAIMPDTGLLESDRKYYWQVKAWNADSTQVLISGPEEFRTAMMDRTDWKAHWISDSHGKDFAAAPMFRKEFDAMEKVISARIYMSACAYAEVRINGELISDSVLDPGYTHYDKRNLYSVTDVTDKIKDGANVLTAVLGNGFYNEIEPVATWNFENARWRDRARFILELHLTYSDGKTTVVPSDNSWKTTSDGPYLSNNIYAGDTYDARKEIEGWYSPGFDDSSLANALEVPDPSPLLVAQKMPQIRITEEIKPVTVTSFGDTAYVFDFGKNISGICRLRINGEAGTEVSIAHTELLKENGRTEPGNINIYYKTIPGYEFQTDNYILKGSGVEEWSPSFTYHGFRYAEVKTSVPMKLGKENLTALYIHTDLESVGSFECSNPLLDTLWNMTRRTYCNNLLSIPTDCPQREKNGWTADAYLSQEIGLLNYDAILFYEKWLDDFIDNQREDGRISGIIPTSDWGYDDWIGPVWDAALFIIPYNLYLYYGDKTIIDRIWPICEKYLAYLKTREDPDGLLSYGIGDWLSYEAQTPTDYTSSLFYYYDYRIMTEFSFILNKESSSLMSNMERLRNAINKKFYNPETGVYASGTQTGQAAALYVKVVPAEEIPKVVSKLEEFVKQNGGHLNFGSMGSKVVLRTLTEYGLKDVAYEMASKEDHPSWLAWIHDGYTSLGETWIMSPKFNDASLDHIFFGDISAWLVNDIAGINKDDLAPGFGHIVISPHFVDGLDWANASYNSVKGLIKAGWKKKGEKVVVDVTIPENTTATLKIEGMPDRQLRSGKTRIKTRLPR